MRKRNNRGGLIKLKRTNIIDRQAPEGFFRVISIRNQEVWEEGTFSNFLEAKKIANDKAIDGVSCYVHGNSPRVLYIAR